MPAAAASLDRLWLAALSERMDRIGALRNQVRAVETQAEVELHQQLVQAVGTLQSNLKAATEAGVDTAPYEKFAADTISQNQGLATPNALRQLIAGVQAKDQAVRDDTSTHVAARQAFEAAQRFAGAQLQRAQANLASARSIPVLKVDDIAAAISALADRLNAATTTGAYQDVGAGLRTQADLLASMLSIRQNGYELLGAARDRLARAQAGGIDVAAETKAVQAAQLELDQAGDLQALTSARDHARAAKNAADVKFNLAVYGPGKVIVISLAAQELEALQDGVVLQDTLITSGRPALPTPPGNWTVTAKYTPYEMVSPWPKSSPFYYNPSWIRWAMLFHEGGYFIHDAPWRYHYGPGSDSEFGGTHGCVNVPATTMSWLFGWTDIGTKVAVLSGNF
jgi:hypothetical protein